jgi:DNA-binding transcriptional LysR family regulator
LSLSSTVLANRLLARGKFRHVQVLLRLAELGSVQRAADAIGVTQSSVTQTLAYLENLLEVRLFDRHARGVTPTAAGSDLLPVARQMMGGLAEAAAMVAARQQHGGSVLRLGASAAAVHSLLIEALPNFHQQYPAIQVHLRELEGEDQLLALARGELDLVVCRQPVVQPQGWAFEVLQADRFVVACRPDHPVLKRRRVDWPALGRETWLLAPADSAARQCFDELAPRLANPVRTHPMVTRSYLAMLAAMRLEPLLALLPESFVRHAVTDGQLAVLAVAEAPAIAPMGLLRPEPMTGEAARAMARHLSSRGTASD